MSDMDDLYASDDDEGADERNEKHHPARRFRSIAEWVKIAADNARAKGFRDNDKFLPEIAIIAIRLMNSIEEVIELWSAVREGKLREPCDKAEKMRAMGLRPLTCLEEEMADRFIRLVDDADYFGIDLEECVKIKHEYNVTRPFMHGGRKA